jgi:hypothetical protein
MNIGDTVSIHFPDDGEGESWSRGVILDTIAQHPSDSHAVHVINVNAFKWEKRDQWGAYDGVPQILAREVKGQSELTFVDTWPRRAN